MKDFSFQGRIELGTRLPSGRPGLMTWVGDQSSAELTFNTENTDRTETYSGQRLQSARLRTATTVGLSLVLRYANVHNLKLGLYATEQNVVGASVVDELLPAALVAGNRIALAKAAGISALSIKDSDTPANTVDPADYTLEDANSGLVRINDVTGYEQPLLASYTHTAFKSLPFFTSLPPERYFLLNGINTVSGERIRLHLYRVQFNPIESLPLINEEFGELTLSGTALFDSALALDPALGGFGRLEMPEEA